MDDDEIKLHGEAYARCVEIFDEIAPEPPAGLSREVFLDLVMQATVCRWTTLPMSRAEQENKIRATIATILDEAPASALDGKLVVQMLGVHETITDNQSRALNRHELPIHREASVLLSLKASEVFMKQMRARRQCIANRQVTMKRVQPRTSLPPALADRSMDKDPDIKTGDRAPVRKGSAK